jgi:RNA-directed DNA polymerase
VGDWHVIAGKHGYRTVKNLRPRILRASRDGELKHVRSLQRLRLKRRANALERVRRVTQVNHGTSTPGLDHVVVTTSAARGTLCRQLSALDRQRVHPARRVYLPKRKGTRPLGMPTIGERCVQALAKNALEPFWEARFDGISDGFRPGRGCHDASATVCRLARPHTTRPGVVDADIDGAFKNTGHTVRGQAIGNFPARELITPWP